MSAVKDPAVCRGCSRVLLGKAYHLGGSAYLPGPDLKNAKVNFYGGFVCSRQCDFNASLEQEQSMPGHTSGQKRLGCFAAEHLEKNWREVTR